MGLMQAIELVEDETTKEPAAAETARLIEEAKERGLLIGKGGLYGNVLRIAPCLNIGAGDVDAFLEILEESLAAVAGAS